MRTDIIRLGMWRERDRKEGECKRGFRWWHGHFIMLTEYFTFNESIWMMGNLLFQVEHEKLSTFRIYWWVQNFEEIVSGTLNIKVWELLIYLILCFNVPLLCKNTPQSCRTGWKSLAGFLAFYVKTLWCICYFEKFGVQIYHMNIFWVFLGRKCEIFLLLGIWWRKFYFRHKQKNVWPVNLVHYYM